MKFTRRNTGLLATGLAIVMGIFFLLFSGDLSHALLDLHQLSNPGSMLIFGFVGAWVLIIVSKIIMAPLLQKDEDYYDKEDEDK